MTNITPDLMARTCPFRTVTAMKNIPSTSNIALWARHAITIGLTFGRPLYVTVGAVAVVALTIWERRQEKQSDPSAS